LACSPVFSSMHPTKAMNKTKNVLPLVKTSIGLYVLEASRPLLAAKM